MSSRWDQFAPNKGLPYEPIDADRRDATWERLMWERMPAAEPYCVRWNGSARYFATKEEARKFLAYMIGNVHSGAVTFVQMWFGGLLLYDEEWDGHSRGELVAVADPDIRRLSDRGEL